MTMLEGSKQGISVQCSELSLVVKAAVGKKKVKVDKPILQNVTASFRSGRLTAIMGSSGAGKTSLLSVLVSDERQLAPSLVRLLMMI